MMRLLSKKIDKRMWFLRGTEYWILFACVFFISGCSSVKELHMLQDRLSVEIPDSISKYFGKNDFQKIQEDHKYFFSQEKLKIYYFRYYKWNGKEFYLNAEGHYFGDAPMGESKMYYPSGKLMLVENYIIADDANKEKVISIEEFNKLDLKLQIKYNGFLQGERKYYDENGKLAKVEVYDKGVLKQTKDL